MGKNEETFRITIYPNQINASFTKYPPFSTIIKSVYIGNCSSDFFGTVLILIHIRNLSAGWARIRISKMSTLKRYSHNT